MAKHEITGLGPKNPDGSMKIFTRLSQPFIVTARWIESQFKHPETGDTIETSYDGSLNLVNETPKPEEAPKAQEEDNDSPFKAYEEKTVIVHAAKITGLDTVVADGSRVILFSDGSQKIASAEMLIHFTPELGDYWVSAPEAGGTYDFLYSAELFEEKYQLV